MRMKYGIRFLLGLFFLLSLPIGLSAQQKIKVMIATGQDGNHWWKGSSDAVKQILENSGLFAVDISVTPGADEDINSYNPVFDGYKLVVFLYGGKTWSEKTQKNFEKYMSDGGGMVVIHSSIVPMADWPAYNQMTGLGAWDGRDERAGPYVYWKNDRFVYDYSTGSAGHHALQRPFTVTHRAAGHPILRGLPPVWDHFKDELYSKLRGPAKNMTILATTYDASELGGSGRDEPLMWTVDYEKGRSFTTVMGHVGNDPELRYAMECTGFQVTLLRGCEWAATGKVTQSVPKDFPSAGVITLRKDFKAPFNAN